MPNGEQNVGEMNLATITAMRELVITIKSVSKTFERMAIAHTIILSLLMSACSIIILQQVDNTRRVLATKSDDLLDKFVHISQQVNVGAGRTRDDVIREEIARIRKREVEQ